MIKMVGQIREAFRRYHGEPDERIAAEMNHIYKIGFLMLTFGFVVDLYYRLMLSQVEFIAADGQETTFAFDPLFFGWFMVTMLVCSVLMCRKGFVDTGRFAETDTFPTGYFALISVAAGGGAGLLGALMRMLAEYQILGSGGIMWWVDIAIGIGLLISVFVLCFLAFYLSYRAAKYSREHQTWNMGE